MYQITVQHVASNKLIPKTALLKRWAKTVLQRKVSSGELTIRIVDKEEMSSLNSTYRKKHKPTNVLSFPFEMPDELLNEHINILGDIVICAEVIEEEAREQSKSEAAHWAHMIVHGTLHLLGYDHENEQDAEKMEAEEINILRSIGFENPYQVIEKGKS